MYLIYVDEYGTSGGQLNDPREPYFSLNAVLVDEKHWNQLETDTLALQRKAIAEFHALGLPITERFEFHAAEMLQGKKLFKGFPIDRQLHYAEELLKIATNNKVKYFRIGIEKTMFHEQLELHRIPDKTSPEIKNANVVIRTRFSPYSIAFCFLLACLNQILQREVERGILIFDENSQYGKLASLGSYALARTTNKSISNLLAAPFFTDSKVHTPLQIADLMGYISGRIDVARLQDRAVKPSLVQKWFDTFISPFDAVSPDVHGIEIVDMTLGILEEMWPADFGNPAVNEYCEQVTRALIIMGMIKTEE